MAPPKKPELSEPSQKINLALSQMPEPRPRGISIVVPPPKKEEPKKLIISTSVICTRAE